MSLETVTTPVSGTPLLHPHHALGHGLLVGGEVLLGAAILIGGFRYLYRKIFS